MLEQWTNLLDWRVETTSSYGAMGAAVIDSFQGIETDTKALSDKLASRATWAREEGAKGFESLGHAIQRLGPEDRQLQKGSAGRPRVLSNAGILSD